MGVDAALRCVYSLCQTSAYHDLYRNYDNVDGIVLQCFDGSPICWDGSIECFATVMKLQISVSNGVSGPEDRTKTRASL